jgi:hypothetical protein
MKRQAPAEKEKKFFPFVVQKRKGFFFLGLEFDQEWLHMFRILLIGQGFVQISAILMPGMHPSKGAFPLILPHHHGLVARLLLPEKESDVHIKGFSNPEKRRYRRGNGVVFYLGKEGYGQTRFPGYLAKGKPLRQAQVPDFFAQFEFAEF